MNDPSDISKSSISSSTPKKSVSLSINTQTIVKVLLVVLLMLLAFWAGIAYEKHHDKNTSGAAISINRGFGLRNGGGFGTVSAISSSSITVQDSRTGTSKTYSITSSTKITDNGQSATASSISDGDRVIVMGTSSSSSDAATIIVNPNFGGGFGQGAAGSGSGSTTSGSSTPE